jgi:hypothetical protein
VYRGVDQNILWDENKTDPNIKHFNIGLQSVVVLKTSKYTFNTVRGIQRVHIFTSLHIMPSFLQALNILYSAFEESC